LPPHTIIVPFMSFSVYKTLVPTVIKTISKSKNWELEARCEIHTTVAVSLYYSRGELSPLTKRNKTNTSSTILPRKILLMSILHCCLKSLMYTVIAIRIMLASFRPIMIIRLPTANVFPHEHTNNNISGFLCRFYGY